jgi:hypothetical protein
VSLIVAKEFSIRYDLMLFPIGFTLLDFYRIISYRIYFYESNMCVGNFPIGSKSYTIHYANPMNQRRPETDLS